MAFVLFKKRNVKKEKVFLLTKLNHILTRNTCIAESRKAQEEAHKLEVGRELE